MDQLPPKQYIDRQDTLTHITTGISKVGTKHIDVCCHNSHDLYKRRIVRSDNVNTNDNPVDTLTRASPREKHEKSARAMGVW